jgi:hypothetical protein
LRRFVSWPSSGRHQSGGGLKRKNESRFAFFVQSPFAAIVPGRHLLEMPSTELEAGQHSPGECSLAGAVDSAHFEHH